MDIKEIKEKKKELQSNISKLLNEFVDENGGCLLSVHCTPVQTFGHPKYFVEIDIRL